MEANARTVASLRRFSRFLDHANWAYEAGQFSKLAQWLWVNYAPFRISGSQQATPGKLGWAAGVTTGNQLIVGILGLETANATAYLVSAQNPVTQVELGLANRVTLDTIATIISGLSVEVLNGIRSVVLFGHSAGGAAAEVLHAVFDLVPGYTSMEAYTWGACKAWYGPPPQPRHYSRINRLFTAGDVVPHLPPSPEPDPLWDSVPLNSMFANRSGWRHGSFGYQISDLGFATQQWLPDLRRDVVTESALWIRGGHVPGLHPHSAALGARRMRALALEIESWSPAGVAPAPLKPMPEPQPLGEIGTASRGKPSEAIRFEVIGSRVELDAPPDFTPSERDNMLVQLTMTPPLKFKLVGHGSGPWSVAFMGRTVFACRDRTTAKTLAKVGNYWLRNFGKAGSVDSSSLFASLTDWFAVAAGGDGRVRPPIIVT